MFSTLSLLIKHWLSTYCNILSLTRTHTHILPSLNQCILLQNCPKSSLHSVLAFSPRPEIPHIACIFHHSLINLTYSFMPSHLLCRGQDNRSKAEDRPCHSPASQLPLTLTCYKIKFELLGLAYSAAPSSVTLSTPSLFFPSFHLFHALYVANNIDILLGKTELISKHRLLAL